MEFKVMTTEKAIEELQKSKGKVVMVAIKNLEEDEDVNFSPTLKKDCETLINKAETIISACDDFMRQMRLFSTKQDLRHIDLHGTQGTILLKN